jgi:hypothetical protein
MPDHAAVGRRKETAAEVEAGPLGDSTGNGAIGWDDLLLDAREELALLFRSGGRRARSKDAQEDRRRGHEHHEKQTRHA